MDEVFAKLQEMISSQFAVDPEEITADTDLADDLGADSVDLVEMVMAIEEEFDVGEIGEEELSGMKTVGDCVNFLNAKLNK